MLEKVKHCTFCKVQNKSTEDFTTIRTLQTDQLYSSMFTLIYIDKLKHFHWAETLINTSVCKLSSPIPVFSLFFLNVDISFVYSLVYYSDFPFF